MLLIGSGGFVGAVGRYVSGGWAQRAAEGSLFPYGTATVNLLGCLAIGLLAGLAGATVLRGMEGFGASSRLHTASILRLSEDLPVVIEIVDTESKIEAFLPTIERAVAGGMIAVEKVRIRRYQSDDG